METKMALLDQRRPYPRDESNPIPELDDAIHDQITSSCQTGDVSFVSGDYSGGAEALSDAMHCPDAIGNPFLHLRLGQCQFELGNVDLAADELTRAFAIEGEVIFATEDPKYMRFLGTKINMGANGGPSTSGKPWWRFW